MQISAETCKGLLVLNCERQIDFWFPSLHQALQDVVVVPLALEDAKCRRVQQDNGQCLPDYATSPNHAYLKKIHWGPQLSILCLLGDRLMRSTLTNCAPVSDRGRKIYGKSESVETTTAHAQNLYWTSTFLQFS